MIAAKYDWSEIPTGIKREFHCYWSILTLIALIFAFADSFYALKGKVHIIILVLKVIAYFP
jgi:hypothetical protein